MKEDGGLAETKWDTRDVERLYQRYGPALVAFARSFLPDAAAAEDAVHGVFTGLLRGNVTAPESEASYLYRAVKNAALNLRRLGARTRALSGDVSWFTHPGGDTEEALALEKALGELPDEQREVVMMRIWSGMTLEEIGAATGVPPNTAASRYRYALEKLRAELGARISKKVSTP